METLRYQLRSLIEKSDLSMREFAAQAGVRRQSITHFLRGGNIHLDNLAKILQQLGQRIQLAAGFQPIPEERLHFDQSALEAFCSQHNITYLAVFGSVLREDFSATSDIDILVDISGATTFFELVALEEQLQHVFNTSHPIHLITVASLSPSISTDILNNTRVLYAQDTH